ncbi:MAG: hypothetical protein V4489_04770, partial [Chlamydiota bacterium]
MINLKVRSDSTLCDLKIKMSFFGNLCRFEVLATGEDNTICPEISNKIQSILASLHPKSFDEVEHALISSGIEVISKPKIFSEEIIKKIMKLKNRIEFLRVE